MCCCDVREVAVLSVCLCACSSQNSTSAILPCVWTDLRSLFLLSMRICMRISNKLSRWYNVVYFILMVVMLIYKVSRCSVCVKYTLY